MLHQFLSNIIIFVVYMLNLKLNAQNSHYCSQRAEVWNLMTVARYIALSLISRYHCLDPANRYISRVHCIGPKPHIFLAWETDFHIKN